jgi:hypothetical protein
MFEIEQKRLSYMEQEPQPIDIPRSECDDGPDEGEEGSQMDEAALILQRAQQEASSGKFLQLTKFLGNKPTKQPSPKTPSSTRDVNCTRVLYRVSNNVTTDIHDSGDLVDRGANGDIAIHDSGYLVDRGANGDIAGKRPKVMPTNWSASINTRVRDVIKNTFDDDGECTKRELEEPLIYAGTYIGGEKVEVTSSGG